MSQNALAGSLLACTNDFFSGAGTYSAIHSGRCLLHTVCIGYTAAAGQLQIYDSLVGGAGRLIYSHTEAGTFEPTYLVFDCLLTSGLSIVIGQTGITVSLNFAGL